MKTILTSILLFCTSAVLPLQASLLTIVFKDVHKNDNLQIQAYLTDNDFVAGKSVINSVDVTNDNKISFAIPANQKSGLLTIYFYSNLNGNSFNAEFDLLYDGSDISLQSCVSAIEDSLQDISNGVNKQFLVFKNRKMHYEKYLQVLIEVFYNTPEKDTFRSELNGQINNIVAKQKGFFEATLNNSKQNIASKYARWQLQSVIYNHEKPDVERLKETFLNRFDFSDPLLRKSGLLESIAQSYLFLYHDDNHNTKKQEEQAIIAVKNLLDELWADPELALAMASKIAEDFLAAGLDRIALFIQDKYMAEGEFCSADFSNEEIIDDLKALKKTQPGNKAPEIILKNGKLNALDFISSKITVVIFYASWCPHCRKAIPQYYEFLKNQKDVTVIAIALDKDPKLLMESQKKFPEWTHIQATEKWDDPLVKSYAVHATPTTFILDNKKIIMGKAKTLNEVKKILTRAAHQ